MTTLSPVDGRDVRRSDLVLSPAEAAELVRDGQTLAVGGSGSLLQVPETLLAALGARHGARRSPSDLTVVHVMGLGDHTGRGVDHIAREGLVRRIIGSHFVLSPREQDFIAQGRVEAFGLPAGTISLLYREIAGGRPGLFTDIGIGTYVDPRVGGGRMNARTTGALAEVTTIRNREWLFYPSFPIDVAFLRGSSADADGYVSMEDEAATSDNLAIAQAVHNSGGLVVVEVKRLVSRGELAATDVVVPAALVDHVVITDYPHQTPITDFEPARTGRAHRPVEVPPLQLDHRKLVARRAVHELEAGQLVNLGVGMANGMSYVALEEGVLDHVTLTVEQGIFGGLPGIGLDSGTALNPAAIVDMPSQFDLYDGGALDLAGLAFAQVDGNGDVNVAHVGGVPIGPGGFIDISQKARVVVFCGTFRGGGLRTSVRPSTVDEDGELRIVTEGRYPKFVGRVDAVCFNADRARRTGQRVVYVTERAVFRLVEDGIELVEYAPGIDLDRDVLDHLPFTPVIREPRPMARRLFVAGPMGLSLPTRLRRTDHTKELVS